MIVKIDIYWKMDRMIVSIIPDPENHPICMERMPYHVNRTMYYIDSKGVGQIVLKMSDVRKLRCFTLGVNFVNCRPLET